MFVNPARGLRGAPYRSPLSKAKLSDRPPHQKFEARRTIQSWLNTCVHRVGWITLKERRVCGRGSRFHAKMNEQRGATWLRNEQVKFERPSATTQHSARPAHLSPQSRRNIDRRRRARPTGSQSPPFATNHVTPSLPPPQPSLIQQTSELTQAKYRDCSFFRFRGGFHLIVCFVRKNKLASLMTRGCNK